jgi:hypothetical protein
MMARGVASLVIRQGNFKRWQSHLVLLVMFGLNGKIGIAKHVAPTRRPCLSHPEQVVQFSRSFHAYGHSFTQAEERGARGGAARDTTKKTFLLLPLAILGLSWPPDNVGVVWIINVLTIASAVAAALIPIFFLALTPTVPEIER